MGTVTLRATLKIAPICLPAHRIRRTLPREAVETEGSIMQADVQVLAACANIVNTVSMV